MDIPMQIIERYKSFRKGSHVFNIGNLSNINKRIKKVAAMCGIKKRVSFHVSRHSWAVLALEYGMPIESVSKILGHTNITTTQIYAKVTSNKLDHDIAVFESRIKGTCLLWEEWYEKDCNHRGRKWNTFHSVQLGELVDE